jgi:DHA2 family lincomycin resistance protein-like MFS transporter
MTTTTELTAVRARRANPYAVLRWLVAATFIVILNETIMINAIPRLMVEFAVTARAASTGRASLRLPSASVVSSTG